MKVYVITDGYKDVLCVFWSFNKAKKFVLDNREKLKTALHIKTHILNKPHEPD